MGYCWLRIPGYGLMAKPLYKSWKSHNDQVLILWEQEQKAFDKLQVLLFKTLALLQLNRPFKLYVTEHHCATLRVLTQALGHIYDPWIFIKRALELDLVSFVDELA